MADIRPFQAFRPRKELVREIAALPYDVYNRQEAMEEVKKAPLSFLGIDRAETSFPETVDMYDEAVYKKASELLWERIGRGDFIQDKGPCYYIYEQVMDGRAQTGIVGCASIDDYNENRIKKHENTREDKEQDRIRHVDVCNAQTGPIFLAYREKKSLKEMIEARKQKAPIYDFVSEDGIGHRIWLVEDPETIASMQKAFSEISSLYIADGHHRCASAVKVGMKRREEKPDYTGEEAFHYFLSVLFPDSELMILDYNRVVKDLHGLSQEAFLEKVSQSFCVEKMGEPPVRPSAKGEFGMYLKDRWYRLTYLGNSETKASQEQNPVENLDVSILQDYLLSPILGIQDPKTDKRIDFVGGIRGLEELEKRVHSDMEIAFSLYPTSIEELFQVADAGMLMPPKSTWFEPKLRSGLWIHSLKEEGNESE